MKPYETPKIKKILDAIKDAILEIVPNTETIYLFGSYAHGIPHENSDLDIFVVLLDSDHNEVELIISIVDAIFEKIGAKIRYDLLLNHSTNFYKNMNFPTMDRIAATTGVKIYG